VTCKPEKIGFKQARREFRALLRKVQEGGQTIIITIYGIPVAKITQIKRR
jgi:prevent-host-death family protein